METRFEKWLFILKNLHKLDRVPEKLKESIFLQLFETAEISKFSQQEYQDYENSLKYYRDLKILWIQQEMKGQLKLPKIFLKMELI